MPCEVKSLRVRTDMGDRKKYYIDKAIIVLQQDGLRLSLEEVAGKMGITKKTLYNHFDSKEELLKQCILSISRDFQDAVSVLDDRNDNAINNLRNGFERIDELFNVLSPVFFYDLMRLNPNQAMTEHLLGSGYFHEKVGANLRQGIKEGVYLADIDIDFICHYLAYSVIGFYIHSTIHNEPSLSKSYFEDIIEYHLRAITSEKGKELL